MYNEYKLSLKGTEDFSYNVRTYNSDILEGMFTVDEQIFFSLDKGYELLNRYEIGNEYQWKNEEKYIAVKFINYYTDDSKIGGVTGINGSDALSEEETNSVIKKIRLTIARSFCYKQLTILNRRENHFFRLPKD